MTLKFNPNYREWRDAFNNEKVFTRRDMANALHEKDFAFQAASQILGVVKLLPNDDQHMMQLYRVERHPNGLYIIVK